MTDGLSDRDEQPSTGRPSRARPLLALRLQGFKSFAERTNVEVRRRDQRRRRAQRLRQEQPRRRAPLGARRAGPGAPIAQGRGRHLGRLGEARRAGHGRRHARPRQRRRAPAGRVFRVLELGRRLYRSGENDYLLNKQRVRLRDLVDLLDAAHLADNAFLFIGQGMVDQALALRPEERRPLFEEVAGVRRHERRRRKAEEQLAESEANLARVEDILAELRPQARRLAAQAEQQATRSTAGDELAAALLAAAHARWHEAATAARRGGRTTRAGPGRADRAMADLEAAEAAASALAADLAPARRWSASAGGHETARGAHRPAAPRGAGSAAELEAIERDRGRLSDERANRRNRGRYPAARHRNAHPGTRPRPEAAVTEADRELAEALAELASLRTATQAQGEQLAALRRAEAARQAESETARRRLAEAERRAQAADAASAAAYRGGAIGEASVEAARHCRLRATSPSARPP